MHFSSAGFEYGASGKMGQPVDFQKLETAVYGEFGLGRGLTAIGRLAWEDVHLGRNGGVDQASGLSASQLGLQYQIRKRGRWVPAIQSSLYFPGQTENGFDLRLGHGGVDDEIRFLLGRSISLAGRHGFADMQVARRFRSGDYADEWRFSSVLGLWVKERQLAMMEVFHAESGRPVTALYRQYSQTKLRASVVWQLPQNRRLQLYSEQAISGQNAVAETGFGIGLWQTFGQ